MDDKNKGLLVTCLAFDLTVPAEYKCFKILSSLGSYVKLFVKTAIYTCYGNEVTSERDESGKYSVSVTGKNLKECVEKFKKPYVRSKSKDLIYLNWNVHDETEMSCVHVLMTLSGGTKEFIMDLLRQFYPLMFSDKATLPVYKKIKKPLKEPASTEITKEKKAAVKNKQDATENEDIFEYDDGEDERIARITKGFEDMTDL